MSIPEPRRIPAVHGKRIVDPDPHDDLAASDNLRATRSREALLSLLSTYTYGESADDERMRRTIWRALVQRMGDGVRIGRGVLASHLETFEIGNGVFIGEQAFLQGRFDGTLVIGDYAWVGPQAYLDARDLVIEEYVGWGPGAKVLGSQHSGLPVDVPIIQTDLIIRPVRVRAWADIGVNAVLLPGVTVGKGAIVGAGAVVSKDVLPFAIVAGVPAKFLRWRSGHEPLA